MKVATCVGCPPSRSRATLAVVVLAATCAVAPCFTGFRRHVLRSERPTGAGIARRAEQPKMPGIGDLMGSMPKLMEGAKKMKEMQEKLKDLPVTGTAAAGRVKVTMTASLVPVGVEIDEALMTEMSGQALSDEITAAMKDAHAQSLKLATTQLSDFYSTLGMKVPPQAGGAAAAAPAPAPSEPPLEFDPLGMTGTRAVD